MDLTGHLHGIHNVFHVLLLEPEKRRAGENPPEPGFLEVDGENKWEVKEVLDAKTKQGVRVME